MSTKGVLAAALGLGVILAGPGCSKDDEEPEFRQIEGTAEKLDLDTGTVALRFFHKKSNTERIISGIVTDQTEVLINGRVAGLKDIRLKERVKVTGYKKGSGPNAQMVAVKVEIGRSEWIETGGLGQAAPAEQAEGQSD